MTSAPTRFGSGERGAVAPLAAVMLAVLIGLGGLATDVGVWYVKKRSLQGAVDAAALAAVNHVGTAATVGGQVLGLNGFAAADLVSAEPGYYCADAALAAAQRFSTTPCATGAVTPSSPNAVRITARTSGPVFLSAAIGAAGPGAGIQARAVAARIDEVGLEVRSGLASADLALANATLQSLLGGSGFALSAVQYDGMLTANVDALGLLDRLAVAVGRTGGTYGDVLSADAKLTDLLQASIDVLDARSGLTDSSAAIAGFQAIKAKVTGNPDVALGSLFDLGAWRDQAVGSSSSPAALKAGLNAYQLASFALQLGSSSHAVTIPAATLGIPNLAGVTLQATAIEPPQSAYFAFGPEGVHVHTAQVRLKLALQAATLLSLPIYVEVAHGDAFVAEMDCGAEPAVDTQVRVRAQTGVASVYLGTVPADAMTNFSQPISYANVGAAGLVNPVAGISIGVRSKSTAGSSTPTDLMFYQPPASGVLPSGPGYTTQGYIARLASAGGLPASPGYPAEVVSTGILGGLGSGLRNNLEVCLISCGSSGGLGLLAGLVNAVLNPALDILKPLLAGLDPLIDGTLKALGVSVGRTVIGVTGARCGVPVLVS